MKQYCIVIPIYKETLDCVEEISLKRLRKVLIDDKMNVGVWHEMKDYSPVYLVSPKGLDTSEYEKIYNVGDKEIGPLILIGLKYCGHYICKELIAIQCYRGTSRVAWW